MKRFANILLTLIILTIITSCDNKPKPLQLQDGDLLFLEEGKEDEFSEAIVNSTFSVDKYKFSHVGVAYLENNQWYVLEAITKGVCKTKMEEFLKPTIYKGENIFPTVIVARLKPKYKKIIPIAINKIKGLIGKKYDFYFDANNDSYYCSELIQQNFLYEGKPIFPPIKMTFKDGKTGQIDAYWVNLFKRLNKDVPEGAPGSNPGQLSKSKNIDIIGKMNLGKRK